MNRKDFLIRLGMVAGGILLAPNLIQNPVLYSHEEFEVRKLASFNLSYLERVLSTGILLMDENPSSLISLHKKISDISEKSGQMESLREELTREVIDSSRQFLKKKPSNEKFGEATRKIDEMSSEIDRLKKDVKLEFINHKRKILTVLGDDIVDFGNSSLREFYKFGRYHFLAAGYMEKTEENSFSRIGKTLGKLSQDSQFLAEASLISGIPMKKIVAFADIESQGREFSIGRDGGNKQVSAASEIFK